MESLRAKKGFLCDMDGVIYHGNQLLPGVKQFVSWRVICSIRALRFSLLFIKGLS